MLPVLHLDPAIKPPSPVQTFPVLAHQALCGSQSSTFSFMNLSCRTRLRVSQVLSKSSSGTTAISSPDVDTHRLHAPVRDSLAGTQDHSGCFPHSLGTSAMSSGTTKIIACVIIAAAASGMAVQAQESAHEIMMGGSARPPSAIPVMAYGENPESRFPPRLAPQARRTEYTGGAAYCVRTCDGRYFPAPSGDSQLEGCKNLCPATETKVFYGGSIDNASARDGKPYSALPNAFRYREELVKGCTCNGKDVIGLASIKPENDGTLRRGDIVASHEGFKVVRSLSNGSPKLATASKADTGPLLISR